MSRLPPGKAATVPGGAPPMSPETARRLAALIVADAQQLAERAGDHGVTAFVGRAVQRERPNERFLQNTLRNLASSNKRAEERVMWAARQAQEQEQQEEQQREREQEERAHRRGLAPEHDSSRQQERRRSRSRQRSRQRRSRSRSWDKRSRHRSGSRSRSSRSRSRERSASRDSDPTTAAAAAACDAAAAHRPAANGGGRGADCGSEGEDAADEQLRQWLAQSGCARGRGSSGPSHVTGPYLPAPAHPEASAVPRGPARPAWLPGEAEGQRRLAPNAGFLRGMLRTQGLAAPGGGSGGSARLTSSSGSSDSDSSSSGGGSKRKRRRHKTNKKSSSKKGSRKHSSSKKRNKRKRSKHRSRS